MKKFIFTANVIAIIALVPAVIFGYLHNNNSASDNTNKTEVVKETSNGYEESTPLFMVKLH